MSKKNSELEERLQYRFSDSALLELALSHRSFQKNNNERLEFLGDALLDMYISELLYHQFPNANEGQMTRARAALVRRESLAELAKSFDLGKHIKLGSGELKSGGHRRASILADALEAILGAVYLDGGFQPCRSLVERLFQSRLQNSFGDNKEKDPKTRLQEWLQARKKALPQYKIIEESGSLDDRMFRVRCSVGALSEPQEASAESKRAAEMLAAEAVLAQLESVSTRK